MIPLTATILAILQSEIVSHCLECLWSVQYNKDDNTDDDVNDDHHHLLAKLECGPMPNVMVALTNIGGSLCSTPQSLADAQYLTAVQ